MRPWRSRTTRPSEAGSSMSTLTRAMAASLSCRAAARSVSRPSIHEGHVAGQDEDLGDVLGEHGERGVQGIRGAARLSLQREDGLPGEDLADRLRGRRDDDHGRRARGVHGSVDDVGEHGSPADGVEHLGQARAHARAQASREHDRGKRSGGIHVHVEAGSPGRDGGSWGIRWHDCRGPVGGVSNPTAGAHARLPGAAPQPRTATASISTRMSMGRRAAWMVVRAGKGSAKNVA